MMWLSMFVIFVMFAAFGSYIIIKQAEGNWLKFDVPIQFTQSTVILLVSSITMTLGSLFTKKANKLLATIFIFSTLILGIIFTYLQWEGWTELVDDNPVLAKLEPDVEALLVNRLAQTREYYRVPIDECYKLVGLIRGKWRGLTGGTEIWKEIGRFFTGLKERAS